MKHDARTPSPKGRTLDEFSVIIERDAAEFLVASVPELPGCHTQAKSHATLMKRVREAITVCLETAMTPQSRFVGIQRIAM